MDFVHILESSPFAVFLCLLLGAIAVSGRFNLRVAWILLFAAWSVGVLTIMRSELKDPRAILIAVCILTLIVAGISYMLHPPKAKEAIAPQVVPTHLAIKWNDPKPITFGTPLSTAQLNAEASDAGPPAYDPGIGYILPVGQHELKVTFAPADAKKYAETTASVSIVVNPAPPTTESHKHDAKDMAPASLPDPRLDLIQQARTLAARIDVISNKYWVHFKEIETENTVDKNKYDPDTYRQHFEPFYRDKISMNDKMAVGEYDEEYRDQAVTLQLKLRQMAPEAREPEEFQGGSATTLYENPNLGILPEISQDLRSLADALQAQTKSGVSFTPH